MSAYLGFRALLIAGHRVYYTHKYDICDACTYLKLSIGNYYEKNKQTKKKS